MGVNYQGWRIIRYSRRSDKYPGRLLLRTGRCVPQCYALLAISLDDRASAVARLQPDIHEEDRPFLGHRRYIDLKSSGFGLQLDFLGIVCVAKNAQRNRETVFLVADDKCVTQARFRKPAEHRSAGVAR